MTRKWWVSQTLRDDSPPSQKTTPGDFCYHIRALGYWHNGHQIDMWRHIHVYSGHGVEMFGNRTHYVDGGWQTHSPELYSIESNPILRRGDDRCPQTLRDGWSAPTSSRFDRASPRRALSSLRLWMICLEKMRKTDSKEPIALIRGKSRLKISDPTPLKEMKSASTNPAKNGWLPGTQN